jgi:hypothetical protein
MADSTEPWKRDEEEDEEELDETVSSGYSFTMCASNSFLELHRPERCSSIRHRGQRIYACASSAVR